MVRGETVFSRGRWISALISVVLLVSGCGGGGVGDDQVESLGPSRWYGDYPIVWWETPYLDLESPDGTFVRAAVESQWYGFQLGREGMFPGYAEATNGGITGLNDPPSYGPPQPEFMWVAPFVSPDPQGREHEWSPLSEEIGGVVVCASSGPDSGGYSIMFTYERSGKAPPVEQQGPYYAPSVNVFGDWRVKENIMPTAVRMERCEVPPVPFPESSVVASDPGWPAGSE